MNKIINKISSGVIFGKDIQKLFCIAKKNNFAIPAINCIGTDSINAVLEASYKANSPIIIQFSHGGSSFIAGKGLNISKTHTPSIIGAVSGALHIHNIAKYYNIPVIIHTDHCTKENLPWIDGLLQKSKKHFKNSGKPLFSSHMLDLSSETLENNIKISKKYFKKMKKINIALEIELGCTGGEEDGIDNTKINQSELYTNPEDVIYAYKKLNKINQHFTIAASFGNVHGVYNNKNIKLLPKILKKSQKHISKMLKLPNKSVNFVFHGSSGSTIQEIQEAISYGVVKMNIDTDIQWATWKGILNYYKNNKNFLKKQIGNDLDANKPNKKFYDPRTWIRFSQLSIINRLNIAFKETNSINSMNVINKY
ncbi:MAG: fructose-bisphosphate aldolase class II [Candidatus Westeberhardia cardiocondylae]|nr:fructose-bisphosphate aldolase class II [Candidatus Westeberhardia cardiocondylae]